MISETSLVVLVGSALSTIAPTILAYAALKTASRVETKTEVNTVLTQQANETANAINAKTIEIHKLANGNLERMQENFEAALARIAELEKLLVVALAARSPTTRKDDPK